MGHVAASCYRYIEERRRRLSALGNSWHTIGFPVNDTRMTIELTTRYSDRDRARSRPGCLVR